jgi:hypothetical protein
MLPMLRLINEQELHAFYVKVANCSLLKHQSPSGYYSMWDPIGYYCRLVRNRLEKDRVYLP